MEPIYNARAEVVGWLEQETIYSVLGCPRAFIRGGALYSFAPTYLGWFDSGYFRDSTGAAVACLRNTHGGPLLSAARQTAECPYLQFASLPPLAPLPPLRPLAARTWSSIDWEEYLGRDALRVQVSMGTPPTMDDIAHLLAESGQAVAATGAARR